MCLELYSNVTRGKIAPRTFYVKLESDAIDHWVV